MSPHSGSSTFIIPQDRNPCQFPRQGGLCQNPSSLPPSGASYQLPLVPQALCHATPLSLLQSLSHHSPPVLIALWLPCLHVKSLHWSGPLPTLEPVLSPTLPQAWPAASSPYTCGPGVPSFCVRGSLLRPLGAQACQVSSVCPTLATYGL